MLLVGCLGVVLILGINGGIQEDLVEQGDTVEVVDRVQLPLACVRRGITDGGADGGGKIVCWCVPDSCVQRGRTYSGRQQRQEKPRKDEGSHCRKSLFHTVLTHRFRSQD